MSRFITLLVLALSAVALGGSPAESSRISTRRIEGFHLVAWMTERPYVTSLRSYGEHICPGALISLSWVVTSARCTADQPIEALSVAAGTSNHYSPAYVQDVAQVIQHPDFDPETPANDISLIRVVTAFDEGSTVRAIALPDQDETPDVGGWSTVAEWTGGATLMELDYPVASDADCDAIYGEHITDGAVCIGRLWASRRICVGDVGAPASQNGKLIGVASIVDGCLERTYPGLFTRIAAYRDWIASNTDI